MRALVALAEPAVAAALPRALLPSQQPAPPRLPRRSQEQRQERQEVII